MLIKSECGLTIIIFLIAVRTTIVMNDNLKISNLKSRNDSKYF